MRGRFSSRVSPKRIRISQLPKTSGETIVGIAIVTPADGQSFGIVPPGRPARSKSFSATSAQSEPSFERFISLLFATFNVIAVANYLLAGIQRLVIITLIDKTWILAIITTIIAAARSGATAFRIQTFSFLFYHLIPRSS
jgi:hypothetical protein